MFDFEPEFWPDGISLALDPDLRVTYERRREALLMYSKGAGSKQINEATGVTRQQLYYLIARCGKVGIDGRPFSYRALIKGQQTGEARKVNIALLGEPTRPKSGMLEALFQKFPEIFKQMQDLVLEGRLYDSKRRLKKISWSIIHQEFLDACSRQGVQAPYYPFSSDSRGSFALRRWAKRITAKVEATKYTSEQLAIEGKEVRKPPEECFERVECDGHYIDIRITVDVPGLNGEGIARIKLKRLWLIAIVEAKSGAVLGYSIAFGENYSAADVARAVRSAMVPWSPRNLTISTIDYKPGECLPNALGPDLAYVCFDEIWLDNAMSHLSDLYLSMIERTVNATPVFGPIGEPNARPQIENFFDILEEAGFHQMDGTTGSSPQDPRRDDSEKYCLSLDVLLDVVDLLVVRFNASLAPGTTVSRNEVLLRAVRTGKSIIRYIPLAERERCFKFDLYHVTKIGNDKGRPVLRWQNARYEGLGLGSRAGLIGAQVLVMASSLDLRFVEVVLLKDGTFLGEMSVEPRWRSTAHTLWTRQAVKREVNKNPFIRFAADIPRAVLLHAERNAATSKASAQQCARLYIEQRDATIADTDDLMRNMYGSVVEEPMTDAVDEEISSLLRSLGTSYR